MSISSTFEWFPTSLTTLRALQLLSSTSDQPTLGTFLSRIIIIVRSAINSLPYLTTNWSTTHIPYEADPVCMPRSPDKRWPSPSEREDRNRRSGPPPPYASTSSSSVVPSSSARYDYDYDSRYGYKRDERRYEPRERERDRYEDDRRRTWTGRPAPAPASGLGDRDREWERERERERDRRDTRPEYTDSYRPAYGRDSEFDNRVEDYLVNACRHF
jgi:hypothetical protein